MGFVVAVVASVALGLIAGAVWDAVAPRAVLQEVSAGTAQIVNAETRAFVGADGWFSLLAAVAGLLTGAVGYRLGIFGRDQADRVAVTAGLIAGAVAGAFAMLWLGQLLGQGNYQHQLASSRAGATFESSLTLGAKSALAFWPLVTSVVILVAETGRRQSDPGPDEPGTWADEQAGASDHPQPPGAPRGNPPGPAAHPPGKPPQPPGAGFAGWSGGAP
jgi:hypothetical protein